ncbi:MAG: hypothetical protein ABFC94_17125 [Syntrophomonas sp.]
MARSADVERALFIRCLIAARLLDNNFSRQMEYKNPTNVSTSLIESTSETSNILVL